MINLQEFYLFYACLPEGLPAFLYLFLVKGREMTDFTQFCHAKNV